MSLELIGGIAIGISAFIAILYILKSNKETNKDNFDYIPHLFPTLGILFTFLGIAVGLWNFDGDNLEKSIPPLLNGLKTAFLVSIIGISASIVFTFITNIRRKKNEEGVLSPEVIAINQLTEVIIELKNSLKASNEQEEELSPGSMFNQIQIEANNHSKLLTEIKNSISTNGEISFQIMDSLITKDKNGNTVLLGNVMRDLYSESEKQTNALKSFSTDLAITISAGFEQILNNPNEVLVGELKLVRGEIENLGNKLKDPATDMTQTIVKDLQESMSKMMVDFKTSMSGDTKDELERLAKMLGAAGSSLTEFPDKLQIMMDSLNDNFKGLQQMVSTISQQTITQSEHSTSQMIKQVDQMSDLLKSKVGDLQSGQQELLRNQSDNLQLSDQLLGSFNNSLEKMNMLSNDVQAMIEKLGLAQNELNTSMTNFKSISQDVVTSTVKFGESQLTFSTYTNEFLRENKTVIQDFQKSLNIAKEVVLEYSSNFSVIESGLKGIFDNINTGLNEYQLTVKESLEEYLSKYSEALTNTANSLESVSTNNNNLLEELIEQIGKLNGKR